MTGSLEKKRSGKRDPAFSFLPFTFPFLPQLSICLSVSPVRAFLTTSPLFPLLPRNVKKCYTKLHHNVTLPFFAMLRNATQMLQITAQMSPLLNTQLQQWTLLSPYKFQVKFFFEFSILTTI